VDANSLGDAPQTPPAEVVAPGAEAEAGKPVKVVLYVDFICPVCKNFETQYNDQLTSLRNDGKITVEYRPLGFLDSRSTTNYSSRAANAAACVANTAPEKYADYFNALYAQQPAEGSAGLSDNDLKKMASDMGVNIGSCVDDKTYRPYVKYTTKEASAIGVSGTPTVFVDGKQWGKGDSAQTPFPDFLQAAIAAKG
jgi:protein-disulfide isomerase